MSSNDKNVLKQLLIRQTRYNVWANAHIAETCSGLPPSVTAKQLGGSFPTLEATLLHIWYAENVWLARLLGHSPASPPGSDGSIVELCKAIRSQSASYVQYVEETDEEKLAQPITYQNLAGKSFRHSPEQIMAHVVNHSSYHRGQIVNYLRQSGIETIPSTDLIRYLRTTP